MSSNNNGKKRPIAFISLIILRVVLPIVVLFYVCNTLLYLGAVVAGVITGRSVGYFSRFSVIVAGAIVVFWFVKSGFGKLLEAWINTMSICGSNEIEAMADPKDVEIVNMIEKAVESFVNEQNIVNIRSYEILATQHTKAFLSGLCWSVLRSVLGKVINTPIRIMLKSRFGDNELGGCYNLEYNGNLSGLCFAAADILKDECFHGRISAADFETISVVFSALIKKLVVDIDNITGVSASVTRKSN